MTHVQEKKKLKIYTDLPERLNLKYNNNHFIKTPKLYTYTVPVLSVYPTTNTNSFQDGRTQILLGVIGHLQQQQQQQHSYTHANQRECSVDSEEQQQKGGEACAGGRGDTQIATTQARH